MFLHNCLDIKGLEKAPQHLLKATIHPQAHTNSNVVSGIHYTRQKVLVRKILDVDCQEWKTLTSSTRFLAPSLIRRKSPCFVLLYKLCSKLYLYHIHISLSWTSTTIYTIVEIFVLSLLEKMYFLLLAKTEIAFLTLFGGSRPWNVFFLPKRMHIGL